MKPRNSLLFVPASRPQRFDKALAAWLDPAHPVMVRINAADTEWFAADLALLARPGVAAVVLPKAEHPDDVLASRLADIAAPIDGVTTALDDAELLRTDALRARRLGFGGKLCIHPRQVAVVNQCFTPDADEIAWYFSTCPMSVSSRMNSSPHRRSARVRSNHSRAHKARCGPDAGRNHRLVAVKSAVTQVTLS